MTARQAAYQVVLRVFEDDAYADRVLRTAAAGLDTRDRALAQRLAFGTVQRVRTLDHAISTLGKRPVRKLDPPVRAAVRVGASPAGLVWPQSRGSQLAGLAVRSRAGERTLDLCAAPGGKATQLEGEVVAVELHPGRARELEDNCRRLGADNVTVVNADATQLPAELTGFDRVLVDAPCSGLGVLAARPDLRWRARPLPDLQRDLLRVAAERVKPGGTIVYSVCTINTEENEAVVDASGLKVEPLGDEWPQFRHPQRPEFLLTLPHVHNTAGFFIARLAT